MKLFKCDARRQQMTLTIVDLPRPAWRVLPPGRWQVVLTVAVIVVTALAWALL
jgi:hypothetical protein